MVLHPVVGSHPHLWEQEAGAYLSTTRDIHATKGSNCQRPSSSFWSFKVEHGLVVDLRAFGSASSAGYRYRYCSMQQSYSGILVDFLIDTMHMFWEHMTPVFNLYDGV